ncbi:MAG: hybrid sensor histidine kinase/response regulator [Candidatus Wallbacteria bacterium]|nr:hybrid sensor histidine kinase/response regulator [Candidatus Wallbacteria bacterium]
MTLNPQAAAGSGRPSVLVVDDEEINRVMIRALLEDSYFIGEADSGEAALAELQRLRYDLVVLDVLMPGIDGFETCRRIKAAGSVNFLPVLMLTSLGDQHYKNTGLKAGADDFLTKPIDPVELSLRVAAFTRLRQQDRFLRQAVDQLRHLDSVKNDLFELIVHDLRSPLGNFNGFLSLLRATLGDSPSQKQLDYLTGCNRAAADMVTLLEGVLDVTLLEKGQLVLTQQEFDLNPVAAEAQEAFAGSAALKRVQLKLAADHDAIIQGDRRLIRRCIDNLLTNAVRYAPVDSAVVIEARKKDGLAWVQVADRGPGVPEELRKTVFQKFFTEELGRAPARRGYGLGLHFVKLTAAAHHGTVEVLDNDGGGSIFRLQLPVPEPGK